MGEISQAALEQKPEISLYSPTPYTDASWAAIKTPASHTGFAPLTPEAVVVQRAESDPFFADYTHVKTQRQQGASSGDVDPHCSAEVAETPEEDSRDDSHKEMTEERIREIREATLAEAKAHEQQERERLLEEARSAGQEEGRLAAKAEYDAQFRVLQESMSTTLEDVRVQALEHARGLEEKAAELAVKIARKLLGEVAEGTKEYIIPLVKEAVALAGSADIKRIRVSPRDYEFIQGMKAASTGDSRGVSWTFEADDSIRIGCVVATSSGDVDFDLDKAWERIRDQIIGKPGE